MYFLIMDIKIEEENYIDYLYQKTEKERQLEQRKR